VPGPAVENAVGAHLLNHLQGLPFEISIGGTKTMKWTSSSVPAGISGQSRGKSGLPQKGRGIDLFCRKCPAPRPLLIGHGGMSLEEFFLSDPATCSARQIRHNKFAMGRPIFLPRKIHPIPARISQGFPEARACRTGAERSNFPFPADWGDSGGYRTPDPLGGSGPRTPALLQFALTSSSSLYFRAFL